MTYLLNIKIRKLTESDLPNALELAWRVFSEFEAPDYSAEGVAEFKKYIAVHAFSDKVKKGEIEIFGAFDRERIVGVIAMREPPHISLLFVAKAYHRRGIARRLFNAVNTKGNDITVNSSPYAVEAYKRLGFIPTNTEQTLNGIRFIPMIYKVANNL